VAGAAGGEAGVTGAGAAAGFFILVDSFVGIGVTAATVIVVTSASNPS
jgi:hypothetical protein